MTLSGTNTYLAGGDPAYVIDPGPAEAAHVAAIRDAAAERGGLAGVLLTHSHSDHSAAVPLLEAPLLWGEVGEVDEGGLRPAPALRPSPATAQVGPFTVLPTPGHAWDHVCLLLDRVCFCGDLILGAGSSIVPPTALGGSLADYMDSLGRLAESNPQLMCPGHGPWITDPAAKIEEYRGHRVQREAALVAALEAGERSRRGLLDAVWSDVPATLHPAAAVAMEAHLEKLEAEGRLPGDLRD